MDFVPWTSFDRIVTRYGGGVRVRSLRCGEQFRIMAFAQMTYRESLRDIEACLGAHSTKAAVKMHTLLDLRGPIPSFIHISDADANIVGGMQNHASPQHQL